MQHPCVVPVLLFLQVFRYCPSGPSIQLYWHSYNLKEFYLILSEQSYFHMVDNLSWKVHVLHLSMSTSLSVDEILLPRYGNWLTNFWDLPFNMEIVPSCLKHQLCFIWIPVEVKTSCCLIRLCSRDSAWVGFFLWGVYQTADVNQWSSNIYFSKACGIDVFIGPATYSSCSFWYVLVIYGFS